MAKKLDFKCIFCSRNILFAVIVLAFVALVMIVKPNFTAVEHHVYVHNPGECHINDECSSGQICYVECLNFAEGICTQKANESIGICTDYCNDDSDCTNRTCQAKTLSLQAESKQVNVCV
ncbi:MAG: hypothetical protein PHC66_05170 [Candidatus Nanoarchaeia archaeon]|nr:hypothetical protein [Candidatus Nanoarchaeia archaeon]MDD5239077.1 hypothetical protein [Candidatus Nanoarchaeia archaeon]